MNEFALGWDIHRKFSKVSLQEMTTEGQMHVIERTRLEHQDRPAMRLWLAGIWSAAGIRPSARPVCNWAAGVSRPTRAAYPCCAGWAVVADEAPQPIRCPST